MIDVAGAHPQSETRDLSRGRRKSYVTLSWIPRDDIPSDVARFRVFDPSTRSPGATTPLARILLVDWVFSTKAYRRGHNMKRMISISIATAAAAFVLLPAPVRADEWDALTYFTFSAAVELPGVALPAGTYMFRHPDVGDRQVVEVRSRDGRIIYGTFLTIPEDRRTPSDRATVTFEERAVGAPEAIKAWFYPGSTTGAEFMYSGGQAAKRAEASS